MSAKQILVVDDEEEFGWFLKKALEQEGYQVDHVLSAEAALQRALSKDPVDLMILDHKMPGMSGVDLLKRLSFEKKLPRTIMMTAFGHRAMAVECLELGVFDFVQKPFNLDNMLFRVYRAFEGKAGAPDAVGGKSKWRKSTAGITYASPVMKNILNTIDKVAKENVPVLILGETGTGKELIASAIHHNTYNPRKDRTFIAINCSSLSESLLESELFGHARGAFTGAVGTKLGIFEAAAGGTLFLDEIVDASPAIQAKLLRVLDSGEYFKLGETRPRKADVRILAATNQDIPDRIAAGAFREDLYQRLKGVQIFIPPLRERPEDIPILIDFYLDYYNRLAEKDVTLSDDARAALTKYEWIGNIRELSHLVQNLVIVSEGSVVRLSDLPDSVTRTAAQTRPKGTAGPVINMESIPPGASLSELRAGALEQVERAYFVQLLKAHHGKIQAVADSAKVTRRHVSQKLKELGINPKQYKVRKRKK
ncbi:MAG: hypothetical protein A3G34_16305 [Candidatus Lindowbacteria bacterium RIFCSPLOWO2_12_FULL_62_27]|nr:MAG: hypothetical protein A3I06_03635 [Candidatus Lindowbacteria bacterium RIFCSPLOWO2_02_FULL_62_12]OGH60486.1 MAG: hypothetical protein A3G34_16305 [Candidatus Lindowbacteria bacterium RIFCSPLOWO2_12_FULL_62_27]